MIGGIEYKLWLDGKPVDAKFYTMIETITLEQGVDLACEARVELEMCADESGAWSGPTDAYAQPWRRLRLEVRNRTSAWIPLIDGPVVSWDASMSGEPGQSTFTLIARDDTELLNQVARITTYELKTDEELIRILFSNAGFTDPEIDKLPAQPDDRPLKHIQRGTDIEMLRSIAEPYDLHVYVLPDAVGHSKGYVKRIRTQGQVDAPALVLNGADRNVETCQVRNDVAKATRYQFVQLDIDKVAVGAQTLSTKWNDDDKDTSPPDPSVHRVGETVKLLGAASTVEDLKKLGTQILPPYVSTFRDVQEVASRAQQRSSFTITATGTVRSGCYHGVLRAYDLVAVSGVNAKLCTTYVVREVTHTFSRSEYRQDFTLMTNSVAKVGQANPTVPAGIF